MPTCTLFFSLPYAIGSDAPCDIDDTLCAFAAAVDEQLDIYDAVVDRVSDSVPMAQVRSTVTTLYPVGRSTVAFDSVDADTANMVDLTADPYTIMLPQGGRYLVYANAIGNTVGTGNVVQLSINNLVLDNYLDDASTPIYLNTGGSLRYAPVGVAVVKDTANPDLTLTVGSLTVPVTFTSITFGAYWVGDLP